MEEKFFLRITIKQMAFKLLTIYYRLFTVCQDVMKNKITKPKEQIEKNCKLFWCILFNLCKIDQLNFVILFILFK